MMHFQQSLVFDAALAQPDVRPSLDNLLRS